MKKIYSAFLILLFLTSCYSYREYPVEYDYSYHGKFKRYKSFAFLKNSSALKDTIVSQDIIENIIKSRLQTQGYNYKLEKPHLLVSYKVYYDSLNFRGYDQPDIESWSKYSNEDVEYNPRKYDLRKGTLLIQLYDRKQERSVWQGYATGVYGNIYFNNERQLKIAVRSILDRYQFLAEDFMENKEFILEEKPANN